MSPFGTNDSPEVYPKPRRAPSPERDGRNIPERRTPFFSKRHQKTFESMLAYHEQKATINGPSRNHHRAKADALRTALAILR